MTGKVLVAYGTTNGSTAQIAEAVAQVLCKEGLTAEARPAPSMAGIEMYDAVVVGGALYAGRRHKDARGFVRRHRRALGERPLWFFSSGPLDASASERNIPPVSGVRRAMERLGVREHVTFGGCLEEGARGRAARMILRNGKGGDFRDYPAIEAWAQRVAKELTAA
ncbi:flavodoxin domain-containing protein [Streptomyces barringtoniae]|uniref:flavodoxin domain-containing protein n=1 Tax=Streptomyces barringtoniae TaxID=2892029 RepID=UPI001E4D66F7|nr:flavodoxin domain-containing protein [Streptomyces barringtoniae]MCC5478301.1 flavodoxin domain-containing protein [Streptomyces barringtoniae]